METSLKGGAVQTDEDLYSKLKRAQRQVEMLDIQEEYIKDEMKNLKRELIRAQEEVKRIQVTLRAERGARQAPNHRRRSHA